MNRKIWEQKSFNKTGSYSCPKCYIGSLNGINKISHLTVEGEELIKLNYPYGIPNLFVGILQCNNSKCSTVISVNGVLLTDVRDAEIDENNEYFQTIIEEYHPKFFHPNLRMFPLTNQIPKNIIQLIDEAFSLYFCDNNSCANKIRTAIENILDDLKAPKKKLNKKNKYQQIPNLHQRIEHFSKRQPQICKFLMALKIIGNEGSHTVKTENDSVLDAFEILEYLIEVTYVKNKSRIEKIAESIINK